MDYEIYREIRSTSEISSILRNYGTIAKIDDIKIVGESVAAIQSHHKLQFHTDTPAAEYIAWYCLESGLHNEFLLILNIKKILLQFSSTELSLLSEISCSLPNNLGNEYDLLRCYGDFNVIYLKDDQHLINYTPWLKFSFPTENHKLKFDDLENAINKGIKSDVKKLFLNRGDLIIIKNGLNLHNRTELSLNSPRYHLRYLIN